MNNAALTCLNLVKDFGDKRAVDNLSLAVPKGCLFGLVGPNGAGKTTTLSMVTGLLRPTAGQVFIGEHDVWADPVEAKRLMGVLPDGLRTFDRLTGGELLRFHAQLRGIPLADADQRSEQLLDVLGLTEDASRMVADYSAGMNKKIGLACALIHNPGLLILDEPLEAVDPVSSQTIRQILRQFVNAGGTVVMSSHVMELVESMCDAVGIVAQGKILAVGDTADVKQGKPLQERFLELVGAHDLKGGDLTWLGHSSASN